MDYEVTRKFMKKKNGSPPVICAITFYLLNKHLIEIPSGNRLGKWDC